MESLDTIDNGYIQKLSDKDEDRFRELYQNEYAKIDDKAAKRRVKSIFRSVHRPKHEVFQAVKDAFHPDNDDGYRTGYEVSFTNPLYEIRQNPADLLLTNTDWRNVNFCFVVCESSGEESATWANRISEVHDLVTGHEEHLLSQVGEEGKDIGHLQFITAVPKEEIPDVDFRFISRQVGPENYALWTVDDDYSPKDSEQNPPPVELRKEEGKISHGKLRDPLEDGVDYSKSINRDVTIALETPPVIALQDAFMALVTEQYGDYDEPREFNKDDFIETYIDLCEIGASGDKKRDLLKEKAENLISVAKEADLMYYGKSDRIKTGKDYRARYEGGGTKKLRKSVKEKFIKNRIPKRKAEMAYKRVKEDFNPKDGLRSELDDETWDEESS